MNSPEPNIVESYAQLTQQYQTACFKISSLNILNKQLTNLLQTHNNESSEMLEIMKQQHRGEIKRIIDAHKNQLLINSQKSCCNEELVTQLNKQNQILKQQLNCIKSTNALYADQLIRFESSCGNVRRQSGQYSAAWYKKMQEVQIESVRLQEQLSLCQQENEQLRHRNQEQDETISKLIHEKQITSKEKDIQETQRKYYQQENEQLMSQIMELKQKIKELSNNAEVIRNQENEKWRKTNESLLNRLNEPQCSHQVQQTVHSLKNQINTYKKTIELLSDKNHDLLTQVDWYKKLLEEAKSQFVSSQLEREDIQRKIIQQNHRLMQEIKKLKQAKISYRGKQNSSSQLTACHNRCHLQENSNWGAESDRQSGYCHKTPEKSFLPTTTKSKRVGGRLTPKK